MKIWDSVYTFMSQSKGQNMALVLSFIIQNNHGVVHNNKKGRLIINCTYNKPKGDIDLMVTSIIKRIVIC